MSGGPSQLETFDPKEDQENGGPTKAIDTSVPGIRIAENLPKVATSDGPSGTDPFHVDERRRPLLEQLTTCEPDIFRRVRFSTRQWVRSSEKL
jgi:hypothetical protein